MPKLTLGKGSKGKDLRRGRMPTKTSINLVQIDKKKPKFTIAIPAIILIAIGAMAFSKFLVIDRFAERDAAVAEVVKLRNQVDDLNDALKQYADVEDIYAHYTKQSMTAEELSRVDRVKILELIASVLKEGAGATTWNVTANILTIEFAESTLAEQNELAKKIEKSPIVDSCIIKRANKDNKKEDQNEVVKASFTVYLKEPDEEEEEEEENSSETSADDSSKPSTGDDSSADSTEDTSEPSSVDSTEESTENSLDTSSMDSSNASKKNSSVDSENTSTEDSLDTSSVDSANASKDDSSGASAMDASTNAKKGSSGNSDDYLTNESSGKTADPSKEV